jgi:hypothetical protein
MTRKRIFGWALFALVVLVGSYVGGYFWFLSSDDWASAKQLLLAESPVAVGKVQVVEPSIFGFAYKSSGEWAQFHLNVTLKGSAGQGRYSADFERKEGVVTMPKYVMTH